jgi:hypothetical protein
MTGQEKIAEVIYLPTPNTLTPDQKQYWLDQAAYWGEHQETSQRAVEYAARQRENALRMLGMIGIERGLHEE